MLKDSIGFPQRSARIPRFISFRKLFEEFRFAIQFESLIVSKDVGCPFKMYLFNVIRNKYLDAWHAKKMQDRVDWISDIECLPLMTAISPFVVLTTRTERWSSSTLAAVINVTRDEWRETRSIFYGIWNSENRGCRSESFAVDLNGVRTSRLWT